MSCTTINNVAADAVVEPTVEKTMIIEETCDESSAADTHSNAGRTKIHKDKIYVSKF